MNSYISDSDYIFVARYTYAHRHNINLDEVSAEIIGQDKDGQRDCKMRYRDTEHIYYGVFLEGWAKEIFPLIDSKCEAPR